MEISQHIFNREQILSIPFWETVTVLRGLMDEICADVLPLPRTSPRPNLLQLLEKQPMTSSLIKGLLLPVSNQDALRSNRNQAASANNLISFNGIVQDHLNRRSSIDGFQHAITRQELISLTFEDYGILPRMYWGLAAQRAWLSPEFQEEIGYKTCSWLRNSIILDADGKCTPTFSANTFWALIIIFDNISSAAQMSGNRSSSTVRETTSMISSRDGLGKIAKALRNAAVEEAYVPGWAGFWDQWLLAKALAGWLPVPDPGTKPFFKAMFDLPVIKNDIPNVVENYASKYQWQDLTTLKLGRPIKFVEVPGWYRTFASKNK